MKEITLDFNAMELAEKAYSSIRTSTSWSDLSRADRISFASFTVAVLTQIFERMNETGVPNRVALASIPPGGVKS